MICAVTNDRFCDIEVTNLVIWYLEDVKVELENSKFGLKLDWIKKNTNL